MEFKFDANQDFQIRAIEAVADLFNGQPRLPSVMRFMPGTTHLAAVANDLDLRDSDLLANLREIQRRNRIAADDGLRHIEQTIDTGSGPKTARFPNFSVEMETGTGKTYVYLRTLLELHKRCGLRKFIVVVPSVAVREGVLKTLRVTEAHLRKLYANPVYRYYAYDSASLAQIRQFALSDAVEVMLMTLDSFNKAANVIRQSTDRLQGETPIHLVQAARPVLILDEPQNMESEKSVAALAALDPLLALRYSATHRNPYNVVYRLTPFDAYRQGLVKKIEVDSVVKENDENRPYIRIDYIRAEKSRITARIAIHKLTVTGAVQEKMVVVKPGDSLEERSGRSEYKGFEVDEINPGGGFVRFANNIEMQKGEEAGADKEAVFEAQIRHTIEEHFKKQARLKASDIKVLSLFFIDRVANYAEEDGIIRRLFDKHFNELKRAYPDWKGVDARSARAAYFAQKRRKGGGVEILDSVSGETREDEAAYDLIMKDKETLLSFPDAADDPPTRAKKQVRFIFSHSALREGWDNPNVFQICTLNQTASPMKKRQEVGRGVRLAVDQDGNRVRDDQVNILTVVANESYRRYVETLQSEIASEYITEIEARYGKPIGDLTGEERRKIEEEYGEGILPPPPRRAGAPPARLRKRWRLMPEFKELWERIKHKTRYSVRIDTEGLLREAVAAIDRAAVAPPRVTVTKSQVKVGDEDIFEALQVSAARTAVDLSGRYPLPNLVDVMSDLMEHTTPPVRLTRRTLLEVFKRVHNRKAAIDNPHEFATVAAAILKEKLADHLINGIRHEKLNEWYEMQRILDEQVIELFNKYVVKDEKEKSVYDLIPCDSEVERQFAKDLEGRDDVKLYLKLPTWFVVPTPVGDYRPDWAIVLEGPEEDGRPILYFVAETKGSSREGDLRPDERRKIQCGAAHFGSKQKNQAGALEGVEYKVVTEARKL